MEENVTTLINMCFFFNYVSNRHQEHPLKHLKAPCFTSKLPFSTNWLHFQREWDVIRLQHPHLNVRHLIFPHFLLVSFLVKARQKFTDKTITHKLQLL